ncbi:MAG: PKD domain-containing protein [Bacteroidota bacterium]
MRPLPVPDTPVAKSDYVYCQFEQVPLLTATQSTGNDLLWYSNATGGIGSSIAPRPSTLLPGIFTYYVSQKVLFGCESFRKKITVKVVATPASSFSINTVRQCQNGNQFVFTSTSTNRVKAHYEWDFGDGQTIASATDSIVNHVYAASGNFTVKLKVVNDSACSTQKTSVITIIPKPLAAFSYPPVICQSQTTVNLIDRSTVPGNVATINKWWWSIGGVVSQIQNPLTFVPSLPGPITVKLVSTTQEGCRSDTVSTILDVHYQPVAAYKYSMPLCNNEIIQFTNLSSLPQAPATETLVKWNWQFNATNSTLQNPAINLASGLYHGKLVSESNFGCRSLEVDSVFTVHAKPNIGLTINDSCITRLIKYDALDLLNTVTNWYWDFGNGLFNGGPQMTKVYNKEGFYPVTLLGKTVNGCKDTLIRPFTIFENKANAGRDTVTAKDEPVQLNAHGVPFQKYLWTPATGLDIDTIETPVALLDYDQLYRLYSITREGCDNNSKILIRRYKGPELYIPSGFTPNSDGKNDLLKVFPVGIKIFHHLTIYNRFGETVFTTKDYTRGWDGKFKGNLVDTGAFIAVAEAIDYKGKPMSVRQTVMLIR